MRTTTRLVCAVAVLACSGIAQAALVTLSSDQFTATPTFNDVQIFDFAIDIDGPLAPGVYDNPALNSVVYNVRGTLNVPTPSGFPAFALVRTIVGDEFYSQGSSLSFEIIASADLSDGLQVSELAGTDPVFVFNGREVDTGRYHPALFQLNADGSGSIRNSNNSGGINPQTLEVVNVNLGDEYITELTFDPAATTLSVSSVPLPAPVLLMLSALGVVGLLRRRSRA